MILNIIIGYLFIGWLDYIITEYVICRKILNIEPIEEMAHREVYNGLPNLNSWQHEVVVVVKLLESLLFVCVVWPYCVYKDYINKQTRIIKRK